MDTTTVANDDVVDALERSIAHAANYRGDSLIGGRKQVVRRTVDQSSLKAAEIRRIKLEIVDSGATPNTSTFRGEHPTINKVSGALVKLLFKRIMFWDAKAEGGFEAIENQSV